MLTDKIKGLSRRDLIRSAAATACAAPFISSAAANAENNKAIFTHGIASGDPLHDSVIIWTRVTNPADQAKNMRGNWAVSETEAFDAISNSGEFKTGPAKNFTVKIDVSGLNPDHTYYYRFTCDGETSPVGTTRTLPVQAEEIKLTVVSCANYSHGHFNVYKEIAERPCQAILHLGDYIYEYAEGIYDTEEVVKQGRGAKPKTEVISLEDYRTRYALYRSDLDLQAAHAAHPFICVWDDHEVANDTWKDGAQNHSEDQGDFKTRQSAAIQAYYEWLPIRETKKVAEGKIYRSFELAQLGTLIMMDTRHIGRDRVLDYKNDLPLMTIPFDMSDPEAPVALLSAEAVKAANSDEVKHITVPFKLGGERAIPMTDWEQIKTLDAENLPKGYSFLPDAKKFRQEILGEEKRTIMGQEQEAWFADELARSSGLNKPWQILGQQLLAGKLGIPQLQDSEIDYTKSKFLTPEIMGLFRMLGQLGLPFNLDSWDGYPTCRERTYAAIKKHANNAIFLAGDTHNAWAFDLADNAGNPVAIEFGTPSVSSPGLESYIPANPDVVKEKLLKVSGELKYLNNRNRGWMELTLTEKELTTQWRFVSTVLSTSYEVSDGPAVTVKAGNKKLPAGFSA